MEFERNIPQANINAIPDKNINFNISATKSKLSSSSANYNDDENYEESENEENENEEIEEKEEEIPLSEERKMVEMQNTQTKTNKKRIYQKDGEENNEEYEEEDEENLRNGETINKERDTLGEEQEIEGEGEVYNDNDEEIEIEEEGEQDEGTEQDYNKITENIIQDLKNKNISSNLIERAINKMFMMHFCGRLLDMEKSKLRGSTV